MKVVVILMIFVLSMIVPGRDLQAAYLGERVLKLSSQGYDVQQLQRNLTYLGFQPGGVDGIFGPQTFAAVKRFQAASGLAVDGLVGKQTANHLIAEVSKPTGASASPAIPATAPSRSFSLSSLDLDYLARLIYGEARGECFEGQVAVAAVALNRLLCRQFGNTLSEVIFQPGAFTAVSDGQFYLTPDSTAYQAAQAALRGWDPSQGAIYYYNPATATSKWIWSRTPVATIGKHAFAI